MSESLSAIANVVVAVAAVASVWILWRTFKSVNAQTEISQGQAELARKQFEIAMRRQEEPDLTATPGDFEPFPNKDDGNGHLSVTVYNCGAIPLRKLGLRLVVRPTQVVIMQQGPLSISPGRSETLRGIVFISPRLGPLDAEIICDFETPDGRKFRKRDWWNLSFYKERGHDLMKSSPVEEIAVI
jgi:hypothetical protein